MRLEDRKYKEFVLCDSTCKFKNYHGKRLTKTKREQGYTPLLTAGEINNGVADFIKSHDMKIFTNTITIDMFGNAFYHHYKCYGDDNIYFFINDKLSKFVKLFIVNMINKNKSKFSYAKQFRQKHANSIKIMLPVDTNNKPDWQFMENYIKSILDKKQDKYLKYVKEKLNGLNYKDILSLNKKQWKVFFIDEIFSNIQRGKRLTKSNQIQGNIPYISSTASNNGLDNFIGNDTKVRIFEDCLTIANSGSVGASFYHKYKFVASDHVTHLKNDNISKYVYLFISTLTNRFKQKYNFNREINDKRISREKILLPIDDNDKPDYNYMEQYIKNLEYKKLIQYMEQANKT